MSKHQTFPANVWFSEYHLQPEDVDNLAQAFVGDHEACGIEQLFHEDHPAEDPAYGLKLNHTVPMGDGYQTIFFTVPPCWNNLTATNFLEVAGLIVKKYKYDISELELVIQIARLISSPDLVSLEAIRDLIIRLEPLVVRALLNFPMIMVDVRADPNQFFKLGHNRDTVNILTRTVMIVISIQA